MRTISAALALYAVCLSTLLAPDALGQERRGGSPGSPKIEASQPSTPSTETATDGMTTNVVQAPNSSQVDIVGPVGSGLFGAQVHVLPNGNIVVTDPTYDVTSPSTIADVGAVYLYSGETLQLISQITGSSAGDQVGVGGVTVLTNGNYIVRSPFWKNGTATGAGAATWGSATAGVSGTVSAANSLVGTRPSDSIGSVTALTNGNYVVHSINWDNGTTAENAGSATFCDGTTGTVGAVTASNSLVGTTPFANVGGQVIPLSNGNYLVHNNVWPSNNVERYGAVTWGSGTTGITGPVSSANSLVGSTASDSVGSGGITILSNGNYVVRSPNWDNGAATNAGAVTWGSGASGVSGAVTAGNSLVGTSSGDAVGQNGVTALSNGNYVVGSAVWNAQRGAATWGNGITGIAGPISPANSLVGTASGNFVGLQTTALTNGNYVVDNASWDNGGTLNVGAVTWGDGLTGVIGAVSPSNSLVGSTPNDGVSGVRYVRALANGNYVAVAATWDNGSITDAGAATFGNGATGITGAISPTNSLVGSTALDRVADGVLALSNGNYLVSSFQWDNGALTDAGAVTWGNGTTGVVGVINTGNSVVGTSVNDRVGSVTELSNGNYVLGTANWDNGSIQDVGAATWANGLTGITGTITPSNSLIGTTASDFVGGRVTPLSNGNYVVQSWNWDNGSVPNVGAATWGNGTTGITGSVTASNSLIGSKFNDQITLHGVNSLPNGNYVFYNQQWDNGTTIDAKSVSYGAGNGGSVGTIDSSNSVLGTTAAGTLVLASTLSNERLVVGRPNSNAVTVFNSTYAAVRDGNWSAATTWNYGEFAKAHDVVVPAGRTVTLDADVPGPGGSLAVQSGGQLIVSGDRASGSPVTNSGTVDLSLGKLNMGANLFSSVCGAMENGQGSNSYIIGAAQKQFCSTVAYTFPVGTASGYAPVNVNITSLNVNPSSLTISSTATVHPTLQASSSLGRFWSIAETGDLTADFVFNYLDADVNGNESAYKLYRVSGGTPVLQSSATLNAATNTMSIAGVSEFSDWAIGNLAPTAASVTVSGRVLANGRPVSLAMVSFYGTDGTVRRSYTNTFGYYQIDGLAAGAAYTATVSARRYTFDTRVVDLFDSVTGFDFAAR